MKSLHEMAQKGQSKKIIHIPSTTNRYCRYQEFESKEKYDPNKPYIRNSSEYETVEERERREELRSKRRWVNKEGFVSVVARSTNTLSRESYIEGSESMTSSQLQFRTIDKSKWKHGHFKI